MFRHPARVARSLAGRPTLPVEDPVELWRAYNARLLEQHRRSAFPICLLRRRLRASWPGTSTASRSCSGWRPRTDEEPFFTDDLRRKDAEPVELPPDVSALYDELRALAL